MKILVCHNYYQNRGGEDQIFEDETALLEAHGHQVIRYAKNNDAIDSMSMASVAGKTFWNRETVKEINQIIDDQSPDLVHVINSFPLISPAIFHTCKKAGLPTVCTIQNYRYFCAHSMCHRDGKACESCLGKIPWRAVRYRCYRNSVAGSAVVASMQMFHRMLRTWQNSIDVICVASEFSRSRLLQAGFRDQQMITKPNFTSIDPGKRSGGGDYAVFVGRLAAEKGVHSLLSAWKQLPENIPLKILGDGPLRPAVEAAARDNRNVEFLGHRSMDEVYRWVGEAACMVFTSTGYESLSKTLIEAMAVGTPVIGADVASIPEIVETGRTGFLFEGGNAGDLASKVSSFFAGRDTWQDLRVNCRQRFEQRYTAAANYNATMTMYDEAIVRSQ